MTTLSASLPIQPATGTDVTGEIQKKKLTDAAQQFEAMFLQQMLKASHTVDGEEDKDAGAGSDTMSSYGNEALAGALAKGKGIGIARQIVAKVSLERLQHEMSTAAKT